MSELGTTDGSAAARHVALISFVASVVTLLAFADSTAPAVAILAVALGHLLLASASWWVVPHDPVAGEWKRLGIGCAMLLLLAGTSWVFEGYASGVGPLYVLVFLWFGLHGRPRHLLTAVPVATIGYAGALLLADARPRLVLSTVILIPIATLVSLLIAQYTRQERRLRRDLEVRERWRGALMATLAHDVRSPLTSVTGAIEILQDEESLAPTYRPLLDAAMRQARRVLRLATGILEVERVEHGALVLDRTRVVVADLGRQVAELTQPEAVRVEVDPLLVVRVDGQRVEQILYNLVSNALRHGRSPVVISARECPGAVEIAVEDHGSGVPAEDVPFLFDRFSSADHSPSSVGLGLWIVHTLVAAHGGEVHYEAPRGGARFVVTLPVIEQPAEGLLEPTPGAERRLDEYAAEGSRRTVEG